MSRLRAAIGRVAPIVEWAPRYRRDLGADAIAGLTTAVMLIPQGMGYAMLAGLPPIVGLYASFAPLLVYAVFGTSRQLAVGPVAMDSILVAVSIGAIAEVGTAEYVTYATLLMLMVGGLQLAMSALRMGFLVNFLSRPVMTGFTAAAALIIGLSQLTHLLHVPLPRTHRVDIVLHDALVQFDGWHLPSLAIGVLGLVALRVSKGRFPRFPAALAVVVVATAAVALADLPSAGVAIVGSVPSGIPGFRLPELDRGVLESLWPAALTIALVAFMEAIAVGKALGRAGGYEIVPNQELGAIGAANVVGSLFGGYPITGGFSRSAVNARAGARTQLAGIITALSIGLTLLFLTDLFRFMPKAILSAIIMSAVFGLIDGPAIARLWRVKRDDFVLMSVTFVATLTLGIQMGILVGVGASVAWFLIGTTRPHFAVLGNIPETETYLNVERHPHATQTAGVLLMRIDAQFYFGNVSFLKSTLRRLEEEADEAMQVIILEAAGVNQLDSSAAAALEELDEDLASRGVRLCYSRVKGPVRDVMARSGYLARLGEEGRIFISTQMAMDCAFDTLARRECRRGVERPGDVRPLSDRIGCGHYRPEVSESSKRKKPLRWSI